MHQRIADFSWEKSETSMSEMTKGVAVSKLSSVSFAFLDKHLIPCVHRTELGLCTHNPLYIYIVGNSLNSSDN
jgi:hypothetical protein